MPLMHESLLAWSLNGRPQPPLLCSPGQGKVLLIGHLLTEGLICSLSDVTDIHAESGPDPCWAITTAASKAHAVSSHRKTAPFPCSPSRMDLTGCIFCTSGRISLEVVRKAARVSIPVLCTEKAVGSLAAVFAASEGIAIYCPGMTPAWYGDPQRFPAHST